MRSIIKSLPLLLLFTLVGCDDNQFTDVIGDNWIKDPVVCLEDTTPVTFKKVAYWTPDESDDSDQSEKIELIVFSSLTHVNYTSITFNADATINIPENDEPLKKLVIDAYEASTKVGISIGEWEDADDSHFNTIANDKTLTKTFVSNISDFIEEYELDGLDVNWTSIDSKTESDSLKSLLKALYEELNEQGKFVSMTAPSGEDTKDTNLISTSVFDYVDFINVLAFDSTSDSSFATTENAKDAINYWTERCVVKNKLVIGIPFYSRGSAVQSYDYIIRNDISYACLDRSSRRNYNGIPTVIEKTNYALSNAGGLMMKSLEQDADIRSNDDIDYSEYSLLNIINETTLGNEVMLCQ